MNPAAVRVAGLLLAAGAGRRYGGPKALVDTGSGPWVLTTLTAMAGCDEVLVVTGAEAARVADLLPAGVRAVVNKDYQAGMGSSLCLGLQTLAPTGADAVLVMLVDLPEVGRTVVDRVVGFAGSAALPAAMLARAAYGGRPGHPVLIGRNHFGRVIAGAVGDAGARTYLADNSVELIECGDIGAGHDVDTPAGAPAQN